MPIILCSHKEDGDCIFKDLGKAIMSMNVPYGVEFLTVSVIDEPHTNNILEYEINRNGGTHCRPFLLCMELEAKGSIRNMPLLWFEDQLRIFLRNYEYTTFGLYLYYHICPEIFRNFTAIKMNDGRYLEEQIPRESLSLFEDSAELLYHIYYDCDVLDSIPDQYAKHLLLFNTGHKEEVVHFRLSRDIHNNSNLKKEA